MNEYLIALGGVSKLDARTKYVLVKWIQRYGVGHSVQMPKKKIAAELGVTDRLLSGAQQCLIERGMMEEVPGNRPELGAYRISRALYRCTPPLMPPAVPEALWSGCYLNHQTLIETLLAASPGHFGRDAKAGLDKPGKLLLAILLLCADVCGVVRGMSRSRLAALAGMDRKMLVRRLRALRADGYLRSYVVGVRGLRLFGAAPGMYFLNLNHSIFGPTALLGVITICGSSLTGYGADYAEGLSAFNLADGVRRDRLRGRKSPLPGRIAVAQGMLVWDESLAGFLPLFEVDRNGSFLGEGGDHKRALAWYLQAKFEEYASILLSENWEALSGFEIPELPELLVKIDSDILRPDALDGLGHEEEPSDCKRQMVVGFIFRTSLQLARRVRQVMAVVPGHTFADMVHCIIPFTKMRSYPAPANWGRPVARAVISFPRAESAGLALSPAVFAIWRAPRGTLRPDEGEGMSNWKVGESSRVLDTALGILLAKRFAEEADVPQQELRLCGLLHESNESDAAEAPSSE